MMKHKDHESPTLRAQLQRSFLVMIFFVLVSVVSVALAMSYDLNKSLIITNVISSNQQLSKDIQRDFDTVENTIFLSTQTSSFKNVLTSINLSKASTFRNNQRLNSEMRVLLYSNPSYHYVIVGDANGTMHLVQRKAGELTFPLEEYSNCGSELASLKGACLWKSVNSGILEARRSLISTDTLEPMGYIIVGIDNDYFWRLNNDGNEEGTVNTAIISNAGAALLSSYDFDDTFFQQIITNAENILPTEKYIPISSGSKNYMVISHPVANRAWTAVSIINRRMIIMGMLPLIKMIILVSIFLLLLSIVLSATTSKSLLKNMSLIEKHIDYISQGDFSHKLIPVRNDELGKLAIQFDAMRERIARQNKIIIEEQATRRKQEVLVLEAKYRVLQLQHNPHFLYNILDSISSLALLRNQADIHDVCYKLAAMLRKNLSEKSPLRTLRDELSYCMDYTSLYDTLYHGNIGFTYDIDPSLMNIEIPSFSIQPLVENAVRHGIEKKSCVGQILILVYQDGTTVVISITDNGIGFPENQIEAINNYDTSRRDDMPHLHIGLENLIERMHLQYGDDFKLIISSKPNKGTRAEIHIPIRSFKEP